jgi:hypothetical protein
MRFTALKESTAGAFRAAVLFDAPMLYWLREVYLNSRFDRVSEMTVS